MSVGTIILIILVIALLGGFSGIGGGPFYGTGYYRGGGLGAVLVIVLIFCWENFDSARRSFKAQPLVTRQTRGR